MLVLHQSSERGVRIVVEETYGLQYHGLPELQLCRGDANKT